MIDQTVDEGSQVLWGRYRFHGSSGQDEVKNPTRCQIASKEAPSHCGGQIMRLGECMKWLRRLDIALGDRHVSEKALVFCAPDRTLSKHRGKGRLIQFGEFVQVRRECQM